MTDYEKKLMRDFGLDAPDTPPRDPGRPAMSDVTELVERLERLAPMCLGITVDERNGSWVVDQAAAALAAQAEEIARLREALERIAGFAPGHGEIAEIIARMARHALQPELAEMYAREQAALGGQP